MTNAVPRARASLPIVAALAGALALLGAALAQAAGPTLERMEIVTASGAHVFDVEIADTYEKRARGLMHRHALGENRGMLFNFHVEDRVGMWMKNTLIPLDMLFVSKEGRIVTIATDATPMSEQVISSDGPAYAVIELNAGAARRIDAAVGDRVRHPAFEMAR